VGPQEAQTTWYVSSCSMTLMKAFWRTTLDYPELISSAYGFELFSPCLMAHRCFEFRGSRLRRPRCFEVLTLPGLSLVLRLRSQNACLIAYISQKSSFLNLEIQMLGFSGSKILRLGKSKPCLWKSLNMLFPYQ